MDKEFFVLTLHGKRWWRWHTTANFILLSEAGLLDQTRQHWNAGLRWSQNQTDTFLDFFQNLNSKQFFLNSKLFFFCFVYIQHCFHNIFNKFIFIEFFSFSLWFFLVIKIFYTKIFCDFQNLFVFLFLDIFFENFYEIRLDSTTTRSQLTVNSELNSIQEEQEQFPLLSLCRSLCVYIFFFSLKGVFRFVYIHLLLYRFYVFIFFLWWSRCCTFTLT